MAKMFEDKVLLEFSLQGFKKKKSFKLCKVYRLLIGKFIYFYYV